jgi:hypothetical protein
MNRATRTIVSTVGFMLGIAGVNHGFFEALQGNRPTNGLIIHAIGEAHRMWVHGTEDAFTIVPNFLITGVLAMVVGLAVILWSVGFVHKRHGPTIFIFLFALLFLVGGGIGQVAFFLPAWAVSTRIGKPLTWWRKTLPQNVRRALATVWGGSLIVAVLFFLSALEIAVFGFVPGVGDPDVALAVCWSLLLAGLTTLVLTFVAGFAHDIEA